MTTPASPQSPWRIFGLTAVAVFLVSLDGTIVLAAFPALRAGFPDTTPATLSWALNAYTIVYAALLVPAGRMADTLGRRRIFLGGLSLFLLASLLCGIAPGPLWLVACRVLQALGAALLSPASLSLILAAFPAPKRPVAVSLWGAVGALAAAFGPGIGGWLVDLAGWQSVFLVNLPLGGWAFWRGRRQLVESRGGERAMAPDGVGIALLILGVGALVLGIVEAAAWTPAAAVGTSLAGLVLLGIFVALARGRPDAALDLTLFAEPSYAWVNAATLVFGATFSMMFLGFFLFLTGVWGYGFTATGFAVTPGPLAVIPVAVVAGRFAARFGHRPLLVSGGVLYALSNVWFALRLSPTPDFLGTWLPGLLLGGISVGLVLPALGGAAVARLRPERFGVGNAANSAIRQIGASLGAAGAVALGGAIGSGMAAFTALYVLLATGGLLTAAISLKVDTRPR